MTLIAENPNQSPLSSKNGGIVELFSNSNKPNFSFLKPIKLRKISAWSFNSLINSKVLFSDKYNEIRIGDFLTRSKQGVVIKDDEFYKQVTIRLYGKGAKVRDENFLKGKDIKTKAQFLVREGQFIFSRIDARNGAFAIATEEIDGAIVTNDFPVYDIDKSVINPLYFSLLISTKHFADYFQGLSSGTTNRQRINDSEFLDLTIPLPPIKVQKKLVEAYNSKMSQAAENERTANELEKSIESYLLNELGIEIRQTEKSEWQGFKFLQPTNSKSLSRWSFNYLLNKESDENPFDTRFTKVKLNQIAKSFGGGTPSKNNSEFWRGNIPWVSPKDMKTDFISETQDYISESAVKSSATLLLDSGHIIFVMRSGILQHTVPVAVNEIPVTINQDLRAFKVTDEAIKTDYLLRYFQYTQPILLKLVKTGTTVQSIDLKRLEDLKIPFPPLKIQTKIVKHINAKKAEIKKLKEKAEDLRNRAKAEFEAELFET